MTVVLFDVIIAVAVTIAASAVIAFVSLTWLLRGSEGAGYHVNLRNFWKRNRKDILIVALWCFVRFSYPRYKFGWLIF